MIKESSHCISQLTARDSIPQLALGIKSNVIYWMLITCKIPGCQLLFVQPSTTLALSQKLAGTHSEFTDWWDCDLTSLSFLILLHEFFCLLVCCLFTCSHSFLVSLIVSLHLSSFSCEYVGLLPPYTSRSLFKIIFISLFQYLSFEI